MLVRFLSRKLAPFAFLILFVFLWAMLSFGKVNVFAQSGGSDEQAVQGIFMEAGYQLGYINNEATLYPVQSWESYGLNSMRVYVDWWPNHYASMTGYVFPTKDMADQWVAKSLAESPENLEAVAFHDLPAYKLIRGPNQNPGYDQDLGVPAPYFYEYLYGWALDNVVFECQSIDGDPPACAETIYQVAIQSGLGEKTSPTPTLIPDDNPNPDPAPGPIDPELISLLQSILGTPLLPMIGALTGGLLAWIISTFGGNRTGLPGPSRSAIVRPGQIGPDGKVWSSQGWIPKATYDYQQKWLQRGWRLDAKTNRLVVQPGAVNDSGQVWYKLPYDEGNSFNWVDKARVQECERNMADGMVYDHGLSGWVKSSDAADFNRSRQDFYDKVSSPESRLQDHERLMQQQNSRDPQYQKIAEDIRKMENELNKWRSDSIKGDMEVEQRKYQVQLDRMETMDRWGGRAELAEAGADVFISVAARLTGPVGKSIEEGYNTIKRTALAVDTGIAKKSIKAAVIDYGKRYVKDKVVETVSSVVSIDNVSNVPGKVFKNIVAGTGKPGIKAFSKTGLKTVKAGGAVVDYGKSKVIEGLYGDGEVVEADHGAGIGEYFNEMLQPDPGM